MVELIQTAQRHNSEDSLSTQERESLSVLVDQVVHSDFEGASTQKKGEINHAHEEILSYGNRALPVLYQWLDTNNHNQLAAVSPYIATLAKVRDIYPLASVALHPLFMESENPLIHDFVTVRLMKVIIDIRGNYQSNNEYLNALDAVGHTIIETLAQKITNPYIYRNLLRILSATGTRSASEYIESIRENIDDDLHKSLQNNIITGVEFRRFRSLNHKPFLKYEKYVENMRNHAEFGLCSELEQCLPVIHRIHTMIAKHYDISALPPTVLPALKLAVLNRIENHPEQKSLSREDIAYFDTFIRHEADAYDPDNPLPSIGIELEVPEENIDQRNLMLLKMIGIPSKLDGPFLTEFFSDPTMSARTQFVLLVELARRNLVPLEPVGNGFRRVSSSAPLSLHINLCSPDIFNQEMLRRYEDDFKVLMNALVYGYISPQRIQHRKTSSCLNTCKSALATRKTLENEQGYLGLGRVELRAGEFKDFSTYYVLTHAQRLAAGLFAKIKKDERHTVSDQEEDLVAAWDEFSSLSQDLLANAQIELDDVDSQYVTRRTHIGAKLNDRMFRKQMRNIVSHYSQRVKKITSRNI